MHPIWDSYPDFKADLERVAHIINGALGDSPAPVREDLTELYRHPGKMLRPAFMLLAARRESALSEATYHAAAAVEMLHGATLIHDDVIDASPLRRGIPTVRAKRGDRRAVLTGDYLLALSLEQASRANDPKLVETMVKGVSRLCVSEIAQDFTMGQLVISREEYLSRIRGKTAELFGLSCFAGALLGGADEGVCDAFYQAGLDFGMAFQIDDDILDYRGSHKLLGKGTGKDLAGGIPTLPLILALEGEGESLERVCRSPLRPLLLGKIVRTIEKGGYLDEAVSIAGEYKRSSIERIDALDFQGKTLFLGILRSLNERDY